MRVVSKKAKKDIEAVAHKFFGNHETTTEGQWDANEYYKAKAIKALEHYHKLLIRRKHA